MLDILDNTGDRKCARETASSWQKTLTPDVPKVETFNHLGDKERDTSEGVLQLGQGELQPCNEPGQWEELRGPAWRVSGANDRASDAADDRAVFALRTGRDAARTRVI